MSEELNLDTWKQLWTGLDDTKYLMGSQKTSLRSMENLKIGYVYILSTTGHCWKRLTLFLQTMPEVYQSMSAAVFVQNFIQKLFLTTEDVMTTQGKQKDFFFFSN